MNDETPPAVLGFSDQLGAIDPKRAEFEAWAYVRDYDVTHSKANPLKYANERTQGAWQAWGHADANWRGTRDIAVNLLRESLRALEYHREQTRPIERNDGTITKVRRALGLCEKCGLTPGCPDCGRCLVDVPEGA